MKVLISIILVLTSFTLSAGQWTNGSTGQIRINWRASMLVNTSAFPYFYLTGSSAVPEYELPSSYAVLTMAITPYSVGSSACLSPKIDINGGAELRNFHIYTHNNDITNYATSEYNVTGQVWTNTEIQSDFFMYDSSHVRRDVSKGSTSYSMNNTGTTFVTAVVQIFGISKNFLSTRGMLNIYGNGCSAGMFDVSGNLSYVGVMKDYQGQRQSINVNTPITFSNNKF